MNIADLTTQNPELMRSVCQATGLSQQQLKDIIIEVIPAFSKGIKTAAIQQQKSNELFNTLDRENENLTRYVNTPRDQNPDELRREGEQFLGLIFGDKEISRNVAKKVAEKTGVDHTDIKNSLPYLATAIMGIFNQMYHQQGTQRSNLTDGQTTNINPDLNKLLLEFFDADKDGSVLDDFMGMFSKFFGIGQTRH